MSARTTNSDLSLRDDSPVNFDALFRRYAAELNRLAYRRLKDHEAAADVVQDGFLRYLIWHRRRDTLTSTFDARNLLLAVVSNLTIDFVRKKESRGTVLSLDVVGDLVDPYPGQDRFIEGREAYRLVKQALDDSPKIQRACLLLNRLGGMTHSEIALKLGISTRTVSNYVIAVLDRCFVRLSAQTG